MNENFTTYYRSPIGLIEIAGSDNGIASVLFVDREAEEGLVPACLHPCVTQLCEYFKGDRKEFTLKLDLHGTAFQQRIWRELLKIPFGRTLSYLDVATAIGNRKSLRAVGNANGRNPICIIVPCHRVIGADGSLTGYGGGLWRKRWLLEFETGTKRQDLFEQDDATTESRHPLR